MTANTLNPYSDVSVAIHLSSLCFFGGGGPDPMVIRVLSIYVCTGMIFIHIVP